jgi:hypothetical protein
MAKAERVAVVVAINHAREFERWALARAKERAGIADAARRAAGERAEATARQGLEARSRSRPAAKLRRSRPIVGYLDVLQITPCSGASRGGRR